VNRGQASIQNAVTEPVNIIWHHEKFEIQKFRIIYHHSLFHIIYITLNHILAVFPFDQVVSPWIHTPWTTVLRQALDLPSVEICLRLGQSLEEAGAIYVVGPFWTPKMATSIWNIHNIRGICSILTVRTIVSMVSHNLGVNTIIHDLS
jgi:hypothetical protein